uniref:ribosomal protein S8 n=1 Tax=Phytophthora quercina TaxID=78236 RepID=UPI0020290588|nr:ribosomal protein S8 [Phytophthora quercina]YP_010394729.1 ribosomal protein S8 [Phytophthora rubi]YP_010394964.1 ribosomal protein S8 [Phytophthora x alni]YP_010395003.1 ribosomal protein S8 [Phytophthora cambivora]DAZ89126.1 TPA_asm: ribosomal protein S8 [Phytophthora quercina]DAZ89166.1 TPA_asm: ribosomal protein S8 [Phytophthora rubi]DAZ89401.1 TPA_asm: ribosomal protein S8 [Phytophthora x alni]DAZ89440.1 TPA_asm: ribosomal protein S8 [Phytophthora cambivora]
MIITDTLSNLFSKIKNGYLAKKSKIVQQKSKQSINILNILVKEGFIKSYKINSKNQLDIYLKYKKNKAVITEIKRLSKPGKRLYITNKDLYKKKTGFYIISTSIGILTDLQAKKLNVGGELICKIF